ncbi:MAG: hypothetical protein ABSE42_19075 [Bryobacteraceae bacterium]|jgi:hypothetical protein
MSKYYRFSGHALGVAAQFHRLDEAQNLNHVVPTLGASVLAPTGGLSRSHVAHYAYTVDQPRKRTLLSVRKIKTAVHGRDLGDRFETEVEADIEALQVAEKLHIGAIRLHFLSASTAEPDDAVPVITTTGSRIEGLHLGGVKAEVVLDEEPLLSCGNAAKLAEFYNKQTDDWRKANAWRFTLDPTPQGAGGHCPQHRFSLVREIHLSGPERDLRSITVDGYTIHWKGFGKIILGEVHVKHNVRRVALVRLAMGSDTGGSGTVGSGESNGQT